MSDIEQSKRGVFAYGICRYYGSEYQPNYGKRADMKKQPRLVKPILAMAATFSLALGVGACGSGKRTDPDPREHYSKRKRNIPRENIRLRQSDYG